MHNPSPISFTPMAKTCRAQNRRSGRPAHGDAAPIVTNITELPRKIVGKAAPNSAAISPAGMGRTPIMPHPVIGVGARSNMTRAWRCVDCAVPDRIQAAPTGSPMPSRLPQPTCEPTRLTGEDSANGSHMSSSKCATRGGRAVTFGNYMGRCSKIVSAFFVADLAAQSFPDARRSSTVHG